MPEISPAARLPDPSQSLRRQALDVLCLTDARDKANAARALFRRVAQADMGRLGTDDHIDADVALIIPGRPSRPDLVPPQQVERRRSLHTDAGRAALIHALCHIEFNAINLALDAVWRFSGMPADYYRDWLRVADEEAFHFTLLADHLGTLGFHYGDFPAHNSLWEMCDRTAGDVLARMALVPRTLEARGSMPRHRCAPSWPARATTRPQPSSTSSCAMRWGTCHRQPLVPLAVHAARAGSGIDLRHSGATSPCAKAARPVQPRCAPRCGV